MGSSNKTACFIYGAVWIMTVFRRKHLVYCMHKWSVLGFHLKKARFPVIRPLFRPPVLAINIFDYIYYTKLVLVYETLPSHFPAMPGRCCSMIEKWINYMTVQYGVTSCQNLERLFDRFSNNEIILIIIIICHFKLTEMGSEIMSEPRRDSYSSRISGFAVTNVEWKVSPPVIST